MGMDVALALTSAQLRALRTMLGVARCVGGRKTDPAAGYVHTATANELVKLGLARHDVGHAGANVFMLTGAGEAALESIEE